LVVRDSGRVLGTVDVSGDAITFSGYVPYASIPDYFATADIFVCASQWHEPLARVHYEAMAAGLPLITTKRGGNAEVMEHGFNGLIVQKHKQPQAFADCINHLLDHPDKAAVMGRYGRLLAEKNYSWKRVAKQLGAVLKSAISSRVEFAVNAEAGGVESGFLHD